jgi:hypothetical protein
VTYAFDATSTTMTDKMTRRTKERLTRDDLRGATPSFWLAEPRAVPARRVT